MHVKFINQNSRTERERETVNGVRIRSSYRLAADRLWWMSHWIVSFSISSSKSLILFVNACISSSERDLSLHGNEIKDAKWCWRSSITEAIVPNDIENQFPLKQPVTFSIHYWPITTDRSFSRVLLSSIPHTWVCISSCCLRAAFSSWTRSNSCWSLERFRSTAVGFVGLKGLDTRDKGADASFHALVLTSLHRRCHQHWSALGMVRQWQSVSLYCWPLRLARATVSIYRYSDSDTIVWKEMEWESIGSVWSVQFATPLLDLAPMERSLNACANACCPTNSPDWRYSSSI